MNEQSELAINSTLTGSVVDCVDVVEVSCSFEQYPTADFRATPRGASGRPEDNMLEVAGRDFRRRRNLHWRKIRCCGTRTLVLEASDEFNTDLYSRCGASLSSRAAWNIAPTSFQGC